MRLTVKQKLLSAFGGIILLMVIIGGVIWAQLISAHKVETEIRSDDVPGVELYLILTNEVGDVYHNALSVVGKLEGAQASFYKHLGEFDAALTKLIPLENYYENDKKNMRLLRKHMDDFVQGFENEILPYVEYIEDIEGQRKLSKKVIQLANNTLDFAKKILSVESVRERHNAESALDQLNKSFLIMKNVMLILTIIAALIAGIIAVLLSRSIISRINLLQDILRRIENGDLSASPIVDDSGDELADLSYSVNRMQGSLKELLRSIAEVGEQVKIVTSELSGVSQDILEGAKAQVDKAMLITAASEQLSQTTIEVANQSCATSEQTNQSKLAAKNGESIIVQMVEGIQQVSIHMEEMSLQMHELNNCSGEVGSVIKVIEEIAEQTNLLALNAAIEAARAGEHGRGFAVVADEVRALAERTTNATKEVGGIIQSIQIGTQDAVDYTNKSKIMVDSGVSQSAGAGAALEQIVNNAVSVQSMIDSIATATEEQSTVSKEIASDISIIHDVSERSLTSVSTGAERITQLESKVKDLELLLTRFKLN